MGWPVHRLGRLLRLEGASLDGPRRRKHNHNRRLHHRSAIAVPRALGDSLDGPGIAGMTINDARLRLTDATSESDRICARRQNVAKGRPGPELAGFGLCSK